MTHPAKLIHEGLLPFARLKRRFAQLCGAEYS